VFLRSATLLIVLRENFFSETVFFGSLFLCLCSLFSVGNVVFWSLISGIILGSPYDCVELIVLCGSVWFRK